MSRDYQPDQVGVEVHPGSLGDAYRACPVPTVGHQQNEMAYGNRRRQTLDHGQKLVFWEHFPEVHSSLSTALSGPGDLGDLHLPLQPMPLQLTIHDNVRHAKYNRQLL